MSQERGGFDLVGFHEWLLALPVEGRNGLAEHLQQCGRCRELIEELLDRTILPADLELEAPASEERPGPCPETPAYLEGIKESWLETAYDDDWTS